MHRPTLISVDQARLALADFRLTVDRKNAEWTPALAIAETHRLLDTGAADVLIEDLLSAAALRTVQDRFNTVFAELDIQMRSGTAAPASPFDTGHPGQWSLMELPPAPLF